MRVINDLSLVLVTVLSIAATSCATARISGPALPVRGGIPFQSAPELTSEGMMKALLGKKADFAACAAAHRASDGSEGKLLLVFDILPSGEAVTIGVRDPEHATLELSCLARVMATCRLPTSSTGAQGFVFPFRY